MPITAKRFQKTLLDWFAEKGRHDLPWQLPQTPYRVWVSEIMLQQTQVNTVIPYFIKFIKRFPNIKQLSCADENEVFHHWSGLGFYARARNLHKTAKIIHKQFNGRFPNTLEKLVNLPGIGRSTAGAILSLANNKQAAILDGNVKRVLARVFLLTGYPEDSAPKKKFWQLAESLTPITQCRDYTQAIMDLGATVCTQKNPACSCCPFKSCCLAYAQNKINEYPEKKPRKKIPKKSTYFLIFHADNNDFLLQKRPSTGIWGGLWSFLECTSLNDLPQACQSRGLKQIKQPQRLPSFKHVFTHFELTINPVLIFVTKKTRTMVDPQSEIWYNSQSTLPGGIPKPVSTLLDMLTITQGEQHHDKNSIM